MHTTVAYSTTDSTVVQKVVVDLQVPCKPCASFALAKEYTNGIITMTITNNKQAKQSTSNHTAKAITVQQDDNIYFKVLSSLIIEVDYLARPVLHTLLHTNSRRIPDTSGRFF